MARVPGAEKTQRTNTAKTISRAACANCRRSIYEIATRRTSKTRSETFDTKGADGAQQDIAAKDTFTLADLLWRTGGDGDDVLAAR